MVFLEALKRMKQGEKVKLPSWGGYWYWDDKEQTVMIHTKDGEEFDIRVTDVVEYTLSNICSDEWMIAREGNFSWPGEEVTFSFGEAIKYLKKGMKLKRKGWNGKFQHIELASSISYCTPDGFVRNAEHEAIGNKVIAFVGTSGVQMGWLASQADMLADDWTFFGCEE